VIASEIVRSRYKRSVEGFVPVLIMLGLGVGFAAGSIVLSQFLGPRRPTPEKLAPYECGMPAVGDARERQSVKFYLVAMIFLLFDIEVAYLRLAQGRVRLGRGEAAITSKFELRSSKLT
jgi:NADH:ubiquinone oxidoreductase subunit 3 (subunit A)